MLIVDRSFGDIRKHKNTLASLLGTGPDHIIMLQQVHGDAIYEVTKPEPKAVKGYDAMITEKKDLYLAIKIADCQAVTVRDTSRSIVANIHNGWRCSAKNIVGKTLKALIHSYGCIPENLQIFISPSIGPCCAEFSQPRKELPTALHTYILENNHVDFWLATKDQCVATGVPEDNISLAEECTVCNKNRYFSYRGDHKKTGRNGVIIWN
ncbi:copper oxidase [Candidatus Peregrinibacteria bacterium]|nr:copper oxidase [Candidatus Peregrinibacteria bacterium]